MSTARTALAALALAALGTITAPTGHADPPCARFNICQYQPGYNGPQLDTWNVPGTYGGWTTNPLLCDPITRQCRQTVPGR